MTVWHSTKDAPRTMWQAARDLFEEAHRKLDADLWERAYRLWVQASASNAAGEPWMLSDFKPYWLPTTPQRFTGGEMRP